MIRPPSESSLTWLSALLVFAITFVALGIVSSGLGLTWDESTYFGYVEALGSSLAKGTLLMDIQSDPALSYWINPHPALQKWSTLLFAPPLEPVVGYLLAWRLPWQGWIAFELALAFHLIRKQFGWRTSLIFLASLMGMPRFVAYASLGIQDGLVALSWLNIALVARSLLGPNRPRAWWLLGALACIAAGAKITGWLALLPVGILMILHRDWRGAGWVLLIAAGSAVFATAITPNFWTEEFYRAPLAYVLYPTLRDQVPITIYYGGVRYPFDAPWHWGPSILYATTPPFMLLLGSAGLLLAGFLQRTRWLLPFLILWVFLVVTPSVPRHDDIRQFLPFIPLAILASSLVLDGLLPKASGAWTTALIAISTISALQAWFIASSFPLSYYSPLVGNLEGAEKRGYDVTLYFESLEPEMLVFINQNLPQGARIAQLPQWSTNLRLLQRHGLLREDIRIMEYTSPTDHDFVLVHRRRAALADHHYFGGRALAEIRFRGVSMLRLIPLRPQGKGQREIRHAPSSFSVGQ